NGHATAERIDKSRTETSTASSARAVDPLRSAAGPVGSAAPATAVSRGGLRESIARTALSNNGRRAAPTFPREGGYLVLVPQTDVAGTRPTYHQRERPPCADGSPASRSKR